MLKATVSYSSQRRKYNIIMKLTLSHAVEDYRFTFEAKKVIHNPNAKYIRVIPNNRITYNELQNLFKTNVIPRQFVDQENIFVSYDGQSIVTEFSLVYDANVILIAMSNSNEDLIEFRSSCKNFKTSYVTDFTFLEKNGFMYRQGPEIQNTTSFEADSRFGWSISDESERHVAQAPEETTTPRPANMIREENLKVYQQRYEAILNVCIKSLDIIACAKKSAKRNIEMFKTNNDAINESFCKGEDFAYGMAEKTIKSLLDGLVEKEKGSNEQQ